LYEGREYLVEEGFASDRFVEVFDLDLVAGRWFEPADAALDWEPIVINLAMARELFGEEDPIGRRLENDTGSVHFRVVGLLRTFRHLGEFNEEGSFYFRRVRLEAEEGFEVAYIHIRMTPGTPADFEETLTARLHAIAPRWTFTVTALELAREDHLRSAVIPLSIGAIVGGFLLLMVVLGLTGVLWQNVTRRTREIGLRRAMGACRSAIHRQVVAEVMITASFGLLLGAVVAIQIPLVGPFMFLPFDVVLVALATSTVIMLLLAGACGLYPGWTATRVQPAEALHYE
jgi:putative ABC transport system permease protein